MLATKYHRYHESFGGPIRSCSCLSLLDLLHCLPDVHIPSPNSFKQPSHNYRASVKSTPCLKSFPITFGIFIVRQRVFTILLILEEVLLTANYVVPVATDTTSATAIHDLVSSIGKRLVDIAYKMFNRPVQYLQGHGFTLDTP